MGCCRRLACVLPVRALRSGAEAVLPRALLCAPGFPCALLFLWSLGTCWIAKLLKVNLLLCVVFSLLTATERQGRRPDGKETK